MIGAAIVFAACFATFAFLVAYVLPYAMSLPH